MCVCLICIRRLIIVTITRHPPEGPPRASRAPTGCVLYPPIGLGFLADGPTRTLVGLRSPVYECQSILFIEEKERRLCYRFGQRVVLDWFRSDGVRPSLTGFPSWFTRFNSMFPYLYRDLWDFIECPSHLYLDFTFTLLVLLSFT